MHKKALIAGIGAIFCWSLMVGFLRLTTVNYGPELGIALIYTLGAVFLFLLDKPTPLKKIPRRYLLIGGVLFATYELFMAFAVDLAQDSFQAIEVSILNYLWPTLTVLFWAVARKSGRAPALFRVIPGAVFATAGIVLAVGGSSLLAGAPFFTGSLWPYLLAISASIIWAIYSVATPRWACGSNSTAYFFTLTAAALWVLIALTKPTVPETAFELTSCIPLVCVTAAIAAGYALWNRAINGGEMRVLSVISYFAPIFSSLASALILGVMPDALFWSGVVLVAIGSLVGWWMTRTLKE